MTDNLYQQEAEFALEALREGTLLARRIRADYLEMHVQMHDRSLDTLADFRGQAGSRALLGLESGRWPLNISL
jgi:hypothetical protein